MYIIKTKQYLKDYKKKIINKHLVREEIIEIEFIEIDDRHYGEG